MTPVPLESSVLTSAAYDWDARTLRLTFRSGAVYDYFDVPPQVYDRLMNSKSHGWTFNQVIKRHYTAKLVEEKSS